MAFRCRRDVSMARILRSYHFSWVTSREKPKPDDSLVFPDPVCGDVSGAHWEMVFMRIQPSYQKRFQFRLLEGTSANNPLAKSFHDPLLEAVCIFARDHPYTAVRCNTLTLKWSNKLQEKKWTLLWLLE